MSTSTISSALYAILWDTILLVGPPLLVATAVACVVGVLQAVTQTQEQTLPQTVKMIVIVAVIGGFGAALSAPLLATSSEIFSTFQHYRR